MDSQKIRTFSGALVGWIAPNADQNFSSHRTWNIIRDVGIAD